jgi:hypothetical protein
MAGNTDLKSHVHTYDRMIGMLKWGSAAVAIIVLLVIWLIAG